MVSEMSFPTRLLSIITFSSCGPERLRDTSTPEPKRSYNQVRGRGEGDILRIRIV
jgi:hypothetical protein